MPAIENPIKAAAIALLKVTSNIVPLGEDQHLDFEDDDGTVRQYQCEFTTYEPAEEQIEAFREVIRILRPYMKPYNSAFHWNIFTPEGLYSCYYKGQNYVTESCRPVFTEEQLQAEGIKEIDENDAIQPDSSI